MLRTNLSTRPFYNERGVRGTLAIAAAIVAFFTLFNLSQIWLLTQRRSALRTEIVAAETKGQELRDQAARLRQAVDRKQLDSISSAAREANEIINQRLFSWTDLLNRTAETLPDDVRITSLRPRIDRDGVVTVTMTVAGRSIDDIEAFMANLEETRAFTDVFPLQDERGEGGIIQATIEGKYAPAP
jgi:Tfp pilus assembly protein PilN